MPTNRWVLPMIGGAALMLAVVGVLFLLSPKAEQIVCNGAPFQVDAHVRLSNGSWREAGSISRLGAGTCVAARFKRLPWESIDASVAIRSVQDANVQTYYALANGSAGAPGMVAQTSGDRSLCIRRDKAGRRFKTTTKACEGAWAMESFTAVGTAPFVFTPPGAERFAPASRQYSHSDLVAVLGWAKDLSDALPAAERYLTSEQGREPEFYLGARYDTADDPLARGVVLHEPLLILLNEKLSPLREGDRLLAVEGHPVFSLADAQMRFLERTRDRARTIEDGVSLTIQRQGSVSVETVSTWYFFNDALLDRTDAEGRAFLRGGLKSLVFGADSSATCVGKAAGAALKNMFRAFGHALDKNSVGEPDYEALPDMADCRWREIHKKYALVQLHREAFDSGGIAALLIEPGAILGKGKVWAAGLELAEGVGGNALQEKVDEAVRAAKDANLIAMTTPAVDELVSAMSVAQTATVGLSAFSQGS